MGQTLGLQGWLLHDLRSSALRGMLLAAPFGLSLFTSGPASLLMCIPNASGLWACAAACVSSSMGVAESLPAGEGASEVAGWDEELVGGTVC